MLIDQAEIKVRGGRGGDGCIAFRREKHVPRGGPSGGDGGHGGRVLLRVDPHVRTLLDFTYRSHYHAPHGGAGEGKGKTGARGEDLVVKAPAGTVVYDAETGERLADLTAPGQTLLVARGGQGGRGNARFATPQRQAPRIRERGLPGEERRLRLELQLIADVGLVGMPNAGKSTLLSRISAARPQIASYPFTTLEPNLGVVRLDTETEFVVADLPGLIEGAHAGAGLGDQFLRHVRRTRLLLHVVDAAGVDGREPLEDYETINRELRQYDAEVGALPQLVVLNKLDLPVAQENLPQLRAELERQGANVRAISGVTGEGLTGLLRETARRLEELTPEEPGEAAVEYQELPPEPERPLSIRRVSADEWRVEGSEVERLALQADLSTRDGVFHLHRRLRRTGLLEALRQAGVPEGASILLADHSLSYEPDQA